MFKKTREKSPYYLVAIDFGWTLLAAMLLLGLLGRWADGRFGTNPWLLLAGIGLGIVVGFNGLFRRLNLLERDEKARKAQEKLKQEPRP